VQAIRRLRFAVPLFGRRGAEHERHDRGGIATVQRDDGIRWGQNTLHFHYPLPVMGLVEVAKDLRSLRARRGARAPGAGAARPRFVECSAPARYGATGRAHHGDASSGTENAGAGRRYGTSGAAVLAALTR
jgi:hypothetical protein